MIVLLGVNHRSAPLEIRERLAFAESDLPESLQRLVSGTVNESLIVSTCNRVEVLVNAGAAREALETMREFLVDSRGISQRELDRYSYHHVGREAVLHLFRVASGLDSMILGEPQITGQVKNAYHTAQRAGTTGTVLEELLQQAFSTAKRVRSETGISRHAVSVASVAVELARQIFGDLAGRNALVLGAGKIAALVATHLASNGVDRIVVSSRTYNRAVSVAGQFGGLAVNWDEMPSHLNKVDIVVSGTGASKQILGKQDVRRVSRSRRGQPLFLIDIAVPRDVDPSVNELDNVYLYDIDDLQGVVDANLEAREKAAAEAANVISEQVATFEGWLESRSVAPTIVSLRESLLELGDGEFRRHRKRLGPMTPDQEAAVRELLRGVINKILHRPIRHLKSSVREGHAAESAQLIVDVFGINDRDESRAAKGGGEGEAGRREGSLRALKGGKDP